MSTKQNPKKITDEVYEKCRKFAVASWYSSYDEYKRRNQNDQEKIISDITIGKIAELLVYYFLKNKNYPVSYPDFNVYEAKDKKFGPDLTTPQFDVQVKSCRPSIFWEPSWTFQCKDVDYPKDGKPLYMAFCEIDVEARKATILSIVPEAYLRENKLFKEPRLPKFIGIKYAVYYNDLNLIRNKCEKQ